MTATHHPGSLAHSPCAAALAAAEQRIDSLLAELAHARLLSQVVEHLSNSVYEGILLLDAAGNVLLVTERLFRLLGLPDTPAAWQGQWAGSFAAYVQPLVAAPLNLVSWLDPAAPKPKSIHQQLITLHSGLVLACDIVQPPVGTGLAGTTLLTLRDVTKQRRKLAELKSISTIADQDPSPIVRIGADLQQRYANPAAKLVSRNLPRARQVYVQQQLRAATATALAQAAPHQVEVAMGERAYTVAVVPFPQEGYVNLYFADITERDAVRLQLRAQQQFMQQVLDTIPSKVFVRDAEQKLVFQNHAMELLLAAAPCIKSEEKLVPGSVAAQELARFAEADIRVLATGEEVTTEDRLTLANGLVNWFYTIKRPLHRPDGTIHVLGVSTDITALKLTQQILERSEKQYRDLMHYGQALIGTCDLQGIILSVNPAFARLLGKDAADIPGHRLTDHMLREDWEMFDAYLDRIAAHGEDRGVLRIRPRGTLEVRYILYHNVVVRDDKDPYIICHGHDITNRILAEEEMRRARLAAEAAVRARENFLANMSHEIRTPMNGVLGVASLLAKTTLTPEQQEYLRIISSSGHHLLAVLNDVLDMAKIASGKLELSLEPFNLCDSMLQAVQPLALQAQEKGLVFEGVPLRQSCPHPWVQADAHRLNQILINLVSNAVKFTPAGGTVRVVGELLAETDTELTVRFRVMDTGIGMEQEVLDRIFENFTQAYADTSRRFGGTGLGLSISKALVERMGGALTVESTYGEGSCFAFVLTLAKASTMPEAAAPNFDTGVLRGVQALLVEDNEINRFVARRIMQEWGVVVTEAVDGQHGVDQFESKDFDVVLMDIQMPGMSGLEATALLRGHPDQRRATVPILALTANAFRADHEHYLASGMNDCLAKPFDEAELYTKLVKLLPH